jgi:hypothetical protein
VAAVSAQAPLSLAVLVDVIGLIIDMGKIDVNLLRNNGEANDNPGGIDHSSW